MSDCNNLLTNAHTKLTIANTCCEECEQQCRDDI